MFKFMIKFLVISLLSLSMLTSCLDGVNDDRLEITINADGDRITLNWKKSIDRDVVGYMIYWGEITDYKSHMLSIIPPVNPGLVNGFTDEADVGNVTSVTFIMNTDRFYQFYLRGYDKNKELGAASDTKYFPYNPVAININATELFADPWHGYLHKINGECSIAWDPNDPEEEVDRYEVAANYINDIAHVTTYQYGSTTGTTMQVTRQGPVGLYEFFVRACDASDNCSDWNSSDEIDGSVVSIAGELVSGNWIVYWMLAAPVWE